MGYYDDELMHYGVKGMKWALEETVVFQELSEMFKEIER